MYLPFESAEIWEEGLSRIHTCSMNTRYKLIQLFFGFAHSCIISGQGYLNGSLGSSLFWITATFSPRDTGTFEAVLNNVSKQQRFKAYLHDVRCHGFQWYESRLLHVDFLLIGDYPREVLGISETRLLTKSAFVFPLSHSLHQPCC